MDKLREDRIRPHYATIRQHIPEICKDCPTFTKGCEGSNQEDCERRLEPPEDKALEIEINKLKRHLILVKAESDGYGSELLELQKECIELRKKLKPPPDKVKAVKEILEAWEEDGEGCIDKLSYQDAAQEICQLFPMKVKLPPNPFFGGKPSDGRRTQWYGAESYKDKVKEALEKARVEMKD